MLKDRREWINQKMETENGKVPDDIAKFYERFNAEDAPTEEELARKAAEDEDAKKNKGKKEKKKEKKGKKGKGGEEDTTSGMLKMGTTEVTRKFEEQYGQFSSDWVARDETDNYKQEHDV
jgi:hypothetical protein